MNLNELAKEAHQIAREHGFYDPPPSFPERIALIHSELSEALEEFRDGHAVTDERYVGARGTFPQKPEGIPSELADVLIRVLDLCGAHELDIERVVREKMNYNRSRPFKHGKAL